jgi:glucose/arabinose dehydrogenase
VALALISSPPARSTRAGPKLAINDTRGAAVARAKLVTDGGKPRLEGLQVIWRQVPKVTGRIIRASPSPDGQYLFLSSGERQKFDPAQDLGVNLGKIIRLLPDGSPAPGNPFADRGGVSRADMVLRPPQRAGPVRCARPLRGSRTRSGGWRRIEHRRRGRTMAGRSCPTAITIMTAARSRAMPRALNSPPRRSAGTCVIAPGDFLFYSGKAFPAWKDQALIAG